MRGSIACLLGCAIVAGACNNRSVEVPRQPVPEHYISDPNSVGFDIEPVQSDDGSSQWLATYKAGGKVAKFKIEIGPGRELDDKDSKGLGIKSGKGKFVSVPGSNASVLLADLRKALEAKTLPSKVKRVPELPFTFVSFGEHLSQAVEGGGFSGDPLGNWTPIKIFIGESNSEVQLFLGLNPVIEKGQLSMKDPDYGDLALAQLARVL